MAVPLFTFLLSQLAQPAAGQALPVGVSTVGGVAEYMGTAVATAPLGMPTLAWNCAKMPAICENVNARNSLSSQGDGYGSLNAGPIELHYDVNSNGRNTLRGKTACPSGWSSRNCEPGARFSGSQIVCADGETLAGDCFPGELWQRNDGSSQCLRTPFISYPGGEGPTALLWSCDEWPPKSTVEGGSGASTACAPLGVSVIGSNILPDAVLDQENQIYSRSEQNYQGDAQNALRRYVSGTNPPTLGIWAFEFDTFYDDDAGSYATRVTYPNSDGSSGTTGIVLRSEKVVYRSEFQMPNGSVVIHDHDSNTFDARGRLIRRQELETLQAVSANNTYNISSTTSSSISSSIALDTTTIHTPMYSTPTPQTILSGTANTFGLSTANVSSPQYTPVESSSFTTRFGGSGSTIPLGTGSPASLDPASNSSAGGLSSPQPEATPRPISGANYTTPGAPLGTGAPTGVTSSATFSQSAGATAAVVTTITPTDVSTTLVDASTVTANTTITTTGPDGQPTSGIELVDCDACGDAALIIFGLPLVAPAAAPVFVIPGVGAVPVGSDGVPLDSAEAAEATSKIERTPSASLSRSASSTVSNSTASATASGEPDACDLYLFDSLGGDGVPEDDSYAEPSETETPATSTTATSSPLSTAGSSTSEAATPPPQETLCAASGGQSLCTEDSDCTCPDVPDCNLVPRCNQVSAARFTCWCYLE